MVIEKNIPLPTEAKEGESRFPFDDMEIGDSFIASTDFDEFRGIIQNVEMRNEDGSGRLFYWIADTDEWDSKLLRIWRVSFADYIDRVAPDDGPVIECILGMVNDCGPLSHSQITQTNLANGAGSKAERTRILRKYAFLFKTSKGKTNGIIYEIA